MKNPRPAGFLSALALAALGCAPAHDAQADRTAVEAVREAEATAAEAGNVAGMAALLASDAVFLPPNSPPIAGAGAVEAWIDEFMAEVSVRFDSYQTEDVRVDGDLAVEYYSGAWTVTPTGGGEPMTETIKGLHVLARQADGSWKLVYDIYNSSDPMPGM